MFEPDWEPLMKDADEHGKTNGLIRGLAYAVRYLMGCREELRHTNGMLAGLLIAPDHRSPYGHGAPLPPPPQPPQENRLVGQTWEVAGIVEKQRPQYTHSTVTEQLRGACEWPDCNCATVDSVPICERTLDRAAEMMAKLGQDEQAVEKAIVAGFDSVRDQHEKTWNDYKQAWE